MCKGLPASGKSTWAASQPNVTIIDSDIIRKDQFGGYTDMYEDLVQQEKIARIYRALKCGQDVISTDPNISPRHEAALRDVARRCGADFEIKIFHASVDECIKRDKEREKQVGEAAIRYWDKKWKR